MFIGYFTERPYQDPQSGYFGSTGRDITDLGISNSEYNPRLGSELYNRYLDEKVYAEEMGFDGVMLNEHHSTPFCMGGVVNVEAAILARITKRVKIVLLGNVLPIWDDPLWLAEELAEIDMISRGRLVTGWVRGTGRESVAHNAQAPFNWERYQEAHDLVLAAWTKDGPFRWEGEHYNYRYVNPWAKTYQQHPSPDLDSRRHEPQHRQVGRRAPLPLRDARHRPGAHQGFLRLLLAGRRRERLRSRAPSTAATSSRSTSMRPRSSQTRPPASTSRVPATPSSRVTRASFAPTSRTSPA